MNFLSIDSGTPHLVVGLGNEEAFLAGDFSEARRTHSEHIMQSIESVMAEADMDIDEIDYYVASEGPGSFTGLRIGIATIQGLAFAKEKPCIKVNTLDAIAYGRRESNKITLAMLDARNRRVYAAAYMGVEVLIPAQVASVVDFVSDLQKIVADKQLEFDAYVFAGDDSRLTYADDEEVLAILPQREIEIADAYYEPETLHNLALDAYYREEIITAEELLPNYYAPTQAERELAEKE